ncbi:hypothetical protein MTO96_043121 [Rhipicephalus appendiculatus]
MAEKKINKKKDQAYSYEDSFDVQPQTAAAAGQASNGDAEDAALEILAVAFNCDLCAFASHSDAELAEHKRVVHDIPVQPSTFRCSYCRVVFRHHYRLMLHLQKHTGSGSFRCSVCAKKFASEQNLLRHVKTVHGTMENYFCHICPRKFTRKDNLLAHIRKHGIHTVQH